MIVQDMSAVQHETVPVGGPIKETAIFVNPEATQAGIGARFVDLFQRLKQLRGQEPAISDETHFDETTFLSRLISAAARAQSQDRELTELIVIGGDGTAGKAASILAQIREGTLSRFDYSPPEDNATKDHPAKLAFRGIKRFFGRRHDTSTVVEPATDYSVVEVLVTEEAREKADEVYGQAFEALVKTKARFIGAGNGCDIARAHNPDQQLVAEDWPHESPVYPMKMTIRFPDKSSQPVELIAVNYFGLGASANLAADLAKKRKLLKLLPKKVRLGLEYIRSAYQLRTSVIGIDNEDMADMTFVNTPTMAKRIATTQAHSTPDFDIVRTPRHRNLLQVARTAEHLRKQGVTNGVTATSSTHTLSRPARLQHDGEVSYLLPTGTIIQVESMRNSSIIVASMVAPKPEDKT
jgi:diacylglycerol kinase family enzyme